MSAPVGALIRDWRGRRRRSQLDLALDVGVSARHLSFVETGRSRPSPELVLALAEGPDVPLRERNVLLLAAGYAPRYPARSLDHGSMVPVRAAIQRMLDAHDPYPGVVIDRAWNVVLANTAAGRSPRACRGTCSNRRSTSTGPACTPTGSPDAPATSPSGRTTCSTSCTAASR